MHCALIEFVQCILVCALHDSALYLEGWGQKAIFNGPVFITKMNLLHRFIGWKAFIDGFDVFHDQGFDFRPAGQIGIPAKGETVVGGPLAYGLFIDGYQCNAVVSSVSVHEYLRHIQRTGL